MSGGGSKSSSRQVTKYKSAYQKIPTAELQQATLNTLGSYLGMPSSIPLQYGGEIYQLGSNWPLKAMEAETALFSPHPAYSSGTSSSQSFQGGCGSCFVFAEAERDEKLKELRAFRDEKFPKRGIVSSGYDKLSGLLIPLMRKSKWFKLFIKTVMVLPLISRAKFYYRKNRIGWLFIPLGALWVVTWYVIGKYSKAKEYTWADFYGLPSDIPSTRQG